MKPDADPVSVRMPDLDEDRQRLLPGIAGRRVIARGLMGVTEIGQRVRHVVPVAEPAEQVAGPLVAGDGPAVVAEVLVGVAQAV
jgi:hypothetical protein